MPTPRLWDGLRGRWPLDLQAVLWVLSQAIEVGCVVDICLVFLSIWQSGGAAVHRGCQSAFDLDPEQALPQTCAKVSLRDMRWSRELVRRFTVE